MNPAPIFVLTTPADQAWTQQLVQQLRASGHLLYLEAADFDDDAHQQRAADAFYNAPAMLVVLSVESALGESAPVFEEWWRSFMASQRPIVTCLVPDAPVGASYWMPFDLRNLPRADFSRGEETETLKTLRQFLESALRQVKLAEPDGSPEPVRAGIPSQAPASNRPAPVNHPAPPPRAIRHPATLAGATAAQPPPIPPAPVAHAIEHSRRRRQERQLWINLLGWPVVVVLLGVLWLLGLALAEAYTPLDALLAVGLALLIGLGVGYVYMWGRHRLKARRRIKPAMSGPTRTQRRPPVYLEVIASVDEDAIGQIFPIIQFETTIGRGRRADVRLPDRQLARLHAGLIYRQDKGQYYLTNRTDGPTVLHDHPLQPQETCPIANGDLIVLGQSVVLQFRAGPLG